MGDGEQVQVIWHLDGLMPFALSLLGDTGCSRHDVALPC